jgi:APA family basic amino acid/polyamine antiporter
MTDPEAPRELPRVLSLKDATMLVVSSVIGVGIFFTPGGVAKLLPSPAWFFAAWLVGGLLALAGALANAELGAMFPRAGGNYVYLRAAYHPMAGFLVGWLSFFAIFTGTVATLALGVSRSLASFWPLGPTAQLGIAVLVILACSAINAWETRAGAALNTSTAYLKVAAMVALVVAGPIFGHANAPSDAFRSLATPTLAAFGVALSPVIFSYLGWNASVFVAGEIDEPEKNLPRSLFVGLAICTGVYVLLTGTFVYALGMEGLPKTINAGEATAKVLLGPVGGTLTQVLVLVSVLGCLNANVLIGPRIAFAMASDGLFFRAASRVSARGRTPYLAIAAQAVAATLVILYFGWGKAGAEAQDALRGVLDYTTYAIVLATIADTSALYVLRYRDPNRARPYRAAGYPWVPALYILANVAIGVSMIRAQPKECLIGTLVLLSGAPVYLVFARARRAGFEPVEDRRLGGGK